MNLTPSLDPEETEEQLTRFLGSYVDDAAAEGAIVGLSGGLDSAVTLALTVEALGPDRVLAALLPSATTPPADVEDAVGLAEDLGCPTLEVPVDPIVERIAEALEAAGGEAGDGAADGEAADGGGSRAGLPRHALGNVKARVRMVLLYAEANRRGRLVVGTGNKSELLTGYFTKHGDGGADILPLGDLYKTQVRILAEHLDVPAAIVEKPPSAGLWEGQTDEEELGLPYDDLDRVLRGIELGYAPDDVARITGIDRDRVRNVARMEVQSRHKRQAPMVPKLGARSSGTDWREKVV